jgi:hypothetical protein
MHGDHDIFVRGVRERKRIRLTYYNKEHKLNLSKLCVPLYYSASQAEEADSDCYYAWGIEDNVSTHFLALPPSHIVFIELTEQPFKLEDYITEGRSAGKIKTGQCGNGSTAGSKDSAPMKPAPEKHTQIAKLLKHLTNRMRQTTLSGEKEPAEDSKDTVGLNANTEKGN